GHGVANRTKRGHLLRDHFLHAVREFLALEILGDLPQRFRGGISADEVDLEPRDPEFLLHHLGHVIDRAMAHDRVELHDVRPAYLVVTYIAAQRSDDLDAAFLEQRVDFPGIAADVVLAQDIDCKLGVVGRVIASNHVFEHAVVGDVVAGGLADPFVTFATESEDVDAKFLLHFPRHGMDIVADQSDRAGGVDRNRLWLEDLVGFLDRRLELLFAAENDLLLHHIRGHGVLEVIRFSLGGAHQIAATQPGIEAAANRAVGDVEDVVNGADDHAAAAGVSAAPLRDNAGDGPAVGPDFRDFLRIVDERL